MHSRLSTKRIGRGRAIVLVAATALGALLAAPIGEGALRAGDNFRMRYDPAPTRGKDAVGFAVNPRNSRHIVAINADWFPGECEYNVSFNGGRTWRDRDFQAPAGFSPAPCAVGGHLANHIDSSVMFGSGDNVYATFAAPRLNQSGQEEGKSVLVARSTNGGRSFRTVVALPGGPLLPPTSPGGSPRPATDYILPKLTVQPRRGTRRRDRIYVVAGSTELEHEGTESEQNTVVSFSNDGGRTWAPPANANAPGEAAIENSQPVIGRDGALHVAWRRQGPGARPGQFSPQGLVVVGKSTDQGRTWRRYTAAQTRGYVPEGPPEPPFRAGQSFTASTFPRLAVERRSGNLYLVYGEGPKPQSATGVRAADHFIHPDMDVYFHRSTDRGVTWSTPKQINDGTPRPGAEITQTRHPNVSVAPDGRVDITWHDRRHWYQAPYERCLHTHNPCTEARLGDTYYAYSRDRGETFSRDRRITDRSINNDVGLDYRFGAYWDYGPFSAPMGGSRLLFGWMDSREGNDENDILDIYLSRVNLRARGRAPVRRVPRGRAVDLSARLSRLAYPGGREAVLASTFATRPWTRVVVVNHRDAAAALAGSVLARGNLGPVLLTPASRLPGSVRRELRRLAPIGAYVIGGQDDVSERVVSDLAAAGVPGNEIRRLDGGDPAGTASLMAQELDRRGSAATAAGTPAFHGAVIANPRSPDAAAASALAANRRLPVLFVEENAVPPATAQALRRFNVGSTLVVGGPRWVSDAVVGQLPSPKRLGGGDQYSTSRAVVAESRARGLPTNMLYVADGRRPIDAAVMGAAVGRNGGLLALSRGTGAGAERMPGTLRIRSLLDQVIAIGGRR